MRLILLGMALCWSAIAALPGATEAWKVMGVAVCAAALLGTGTFKLESRIVMALLIYVGAALLSTAFALDPALAIVGSLARSQGLLSAMAMIVLAAAAATLGSEQRLRLYRLAAFTGLGMSAYVLLQKAGMDPVVWDGQSQERPAGTMGNATTLAGWLVLLLPMTVLWLRQGPASRWWMVAAVSLQMAALLACGSRSAGLALVTVGLMVLVMRYRRWRLLPLLISGLLVLGVLLISLRPDSISDRGYLWSLASHSLLNAPVVMDTDGRVDNLRPLRTWLGYGPDQQQAALAASSGVVAGGRDAAQGWQADRAHQGLLDRLLETGVLGLLALCVVAVSAIVALRRGWRSEHCRPEAMALMVALGAWMLHLQASFALTGDYVLAWVLIGCAWAMGRGDARQIDSEAPSSSFHQNNAMKRTTSHAQVFAILLRAGMAGFLLLGALAVASWLPMSWLERLTPALVADRHYIEGQQQYLHAVTSTSTESPELLLDAARDFERAADLNRHDRDAAFAAVSAWIEAYAAGADESALHRAQIRLHQLEQAAAGDPRLVPVQARVSGLMGTRPPLSDPDRKP